MVERINGIWGLIVALGYTLIWYGIHALQPGYEHDRVFWVMAIVNAILGLLIGDFIRRLREDSITDPLTRLYNRNSFTPLLDKQLAMARRYRNSFSLAMIDLDNFKAYNDSRGHVAGDNLLVEVAGCLQKSIRDSDTVARFGGDEFILLLPNTTHVEASQLVNRLEKQILGVLGDRQVSLSIGIASYPEDESTARELIQRADKAMYCVKNLRKGFDEHFVVNEN